MINIILVNFVKQTPGYATECACITYTSNMDNGFNRIRCIILMLLFKINA